MFSHCGADSGIIAETGEVGCAAGGVGEVGEREEGVEGVLRAGLRGGTGSGFCGLYS